MTLSGEQVSHQQFGIGTIAAQTETCVEVLFQAHETAKKFLYPFAFERHLSLYNQDLQQKVLEELWLIRAQETEERARRAAQAEREHEEKRQAVLALKRKTAKKRASAKTVR